MVFRVAADPHPWPCVAQAAPADCAVIVVDVQHDYCTPGFYMDKAGYDTGRLREPIPRIQEILSAARRSGVHVIYSQHGRRRTTAETASGASPCKPSFPLTACRGEPGWEIVPELEPQQRDVVVQKHTINAFFSGALAEALTEANVHHLAFCGNTIDVCVHSTLRAAVDLGYDCLLLADCCGAVNDDLHRWAIESVRIENGVFGTVATAASFVQAIRHA